MTASMCLPRSLRAARSAAVVLLAASCMAVWPVDARAQNNQEFGLFEVRVARYFNIHAPDPADVRRFKPTDVYKQHPGPIEIDGSTKWFDHKVVLTVEAPNSVRDGQDAVFNATSTATMTYRFEQPTTWGGFDVAVAYRYIEAAFDKKLGTPQNPLPSGTYTISANKPATVPVQGGDGVIRGYSDNTGEYRSIFIETRSGNMGNQIIIETHWVYKRGHPAPANPATPTTPTTPTTPDAPQPAPCPPNVGGKWMGPVSGLYDFTISGNTATGTIANLDAKYGLVNVTGTVNGKSFTGTWRGASARGTINITGPDANCVLQMTYTVDEPPGPGGRESTPRVLPDGTVATPGSTPGGTTPGAPGTGAAPGRPWETPAGRDCFEQWIALATRLINQYDGGEQHNGRKPWSFNKYGLLEAKGITSAFAPDDFAAHGNDRNWWMWDFYVTDAQGRYQNDMLNRAGVPPLRDYVTRCIGDRGGAPGTPDTATGDGLTLIAPDVVVPRGTQVLIPVRLLNARDVLNMDFSMAFDPAVAAPQTQVDRGPVVSQIFEYNLAAPNQFRFNFASLTPYTGSGAVGGFRFDAVGPPRSRTPLTLAVNTVNNSAGQRLPITLIHGSITVYDPADLNDPNNPAAAGRSTATCSGTGRQTVADAQCALKMWVGLTPRGNQMDVNTDGSVDSLDAVIILQNVARELSR